MTEASVLDLAATLLEHHAGREPEPHQMPPEGRWRFWFLCAGRDSGKSWAGADYMTKHVHGPPCLSGSMPHRMAIVAPTLGDAVQACYKEPAGLKAHDPKARNVSEKGGTFVRWPNGSEAKLFGAHDADDVERLRAGGNICLVWFEELAAMNHPRAAWDQMEFGLRAGPDPRGIITSTPKPKPIVKELLEDHRVATTRATTHDNPHSPPDRRAEILAKYEGTRLGRQEIYAEVLDDMEGALWNRDTIEKLRVPGVTTRLTKICVGVDPSAWMGEDEASEREDEVELGKGVETGIVAAGIGGCPKSPCDHKGSGLHVYRLDDVSGRFPPEVWAVKAVDLYHQLRELYGCHIEMTPEVNMGGPLVFTTIRSVDRGDEVLFTMTNKKPGVRASDSKRARAEPVAALEQQNRAHSVGGLPTLEDQLCSWLPTLSWSPDRLDAYAWAVHGLNPWRSHKASGKKAKGRIPKARPGRASQDVKRRATIVTPRRR